MSVWRLRDIHDDDLDQVIRLWDQGRQSEVDHPVFPVSEVIAAARGGQPAVVAVAGPELVGLAVAGADGERAWIMLVALSDAWQDQGLGSALIAEVERRLRQTGVRRISALLAPGAIGGSALENSGYRQVNGLIYYEKVERLGAGDAGLLTELGGRILPRGLWASVAGMREAKDAIERRIVLPLAEPEVAERHGVRPPKAVILFGPPGTGKTSFAKAVSSRLGWPFVELFPSRLAGESPASLAVALREAFSLVAELDKVVLFIDEVEEIAGTRQPRTVSAAQGVTNEMLKLIPPFREQDDRLLICATNSVRALDSAFLRHGRFDYVIPVGPPDPAAREAIWDRYLAAIPHGELDMAAIVEESRLFTPADIEFAARRTAQLAFERVLFEHGEEQVTTGDVLRAVGQTRRTLTPELVAEFEQDIQDYARV